MALLRDLVHLLLPCSDSIIRSSCMYLPRRLNILYYLVVCLLPTLFAFLGSQSGLEGTLVPSIRGKLKENVGSRWKSLDPFLKLMRSDNARDQAIHHLDRIRKSIRMYSNVQDSHDWMKEVIKNLLVTSVQLRLN